VPIALISGLFRRDPRARHRRRVRSDLAQVPVDPLKHAGLRRTLAGSADLPFAR
jgi:hypothetical protein